MRDSARHDTVRKRRTGARRDVILETRAKLCCDGKKKEMKMMEDPNHVSSTAPGPDLSFWNKENVSRTSPPSDVGSLPPGQWPADREPVVPELVG